MIDEIVNPFFSIKSIGHQWYWSCEYPEFNNIEFDSYILNYFKFKSISIIRKLSNHSNKNSITINYCTTSTDVIHSWTVP